VTSLVIGSHHLLSLGDDSALPLRSRNHAIDRLCQFIPADGLLVSPGSENCSLVNEILEIGARETRRLTRQVFDGHFVLERFATRVNIENRSSTLNVWAIENNLAVESAGTKQGRIENVRSIRGSNDDHVRAAIESVHLNQYLIQRLLTLVVTTAKSCAALATDRVDFVDEDDARRTLLCLVEEIANAARADANEHLNELRTGDAEKRDARLARYRSGEQGLSGTWRSYEQNAARYARAECLELVGIFQELDNFDELFFSFLDSCHVRKRDGRFIPSEEARPTLAERYGLVITALGLTHHEDEDAYQEKRRQYECERAKPASPATRCLNLDIDRG
jgi:hypothetical protein